MWMDMRVANVILETDATNLKIALSSTAYDLSAYGILFREANFLMISEFNEVQVAYRPCFCNSLADRLAKYGSELETDAIITWPEGINDLVATDLQLA